MKLHHLILAAALASVTLAWGQTKTAPQSWTSTDGRTIQANFVKLDGEAVVIDMGGKQFTVPFAKLTAESVTQAKRAAIASRPAITPIAPAAGPKAGEPHLLPEAQMIADGWLAAAVKGQSSTLLPIYCDEVGDVLFPVGAQVVSGNGRGLVKLSGYDGNLIWSVAPQDMAEGAWDMPEVVRDAAGDFVVGMEIEIKGKGKDIALVKIEGATGKVLWKWHQDGPQHGDDNLTGLAVDSAGEVLVSIDSGGELIPHPRAEEGFAPYSPPETLDSTLVKVDGKTGQPLWEAREHAISGARDRGKLIKEQPDAVVLLRHERKNQAFLLGLDPASGKVQWQIEGANDWRHPWNLLPKGILHLNTKEWMLTDFTGKNLWTSPVAEGRYERVWGHAESAVWIDWLSNKQQIENKPRYGCSVRLMQIADGAVSVRKDPLFTATELADMGGPTTLEDPWRNGVCDKAGDLIVIGYGPSTGDKYDFLPRLMKVSAKDGTMVWTKDIPLLAGKNPGDEPLLKFDPDGNLLYLWMEGEEVTSKSNPEQKDAVTSLAKISPATGEMIWHQRIRAHLGGTVSATNWQLDAAGNIFVVFSAPGRFGAGPTGTSAFKASMTAMKFSGKDGAVEWLRGFPYNQ